MRESRDLPEFDPTDLLNELSADAEFAAQPLPAAEVRRRGNRRRTVRRTGIAAAALGLSLIAGTSRAAANGLFGADDRQWAGTTTRAVPATVPPSASPAPTTSSSSVPTKPTTTTTKATQATTGASSPPTSTIKKGSLVAAQASDLYYHTRGEFTVTDEFAGLGQNSPVSAFPTDDYGAQGVFVRDFVRTQKDVEVRTATYRFRSADEAKAAYAKLVSYVTEYPASQVGGEYEWDVKGSDFHPVDLSSVDAASKQATFTTIVYSGIGSQHGKGMFEDVGIVQVGPYVEFVGYHYEGLDSNWDYEPGSPVGALHPLVRSLPLVAARLAS